MNEVTCQTAALLLDAVERCGKDPVRLWAGLPVSRTILRDPKGRIDWDTWVEMMQRSEDACGGPEQTPALFVRGAGARTGHPFVRVANTFLSVQWLYELFGRWGLRSTMTVLEGRFELRTSRLARMTIAISNARAGSTPTLRFIVGILRSLPTLMDLPPAEVSLLEVSPYRAVYEILLPRERSVLTRARRVFAVATGAAAALDTLEAQSREISEKHAELDERLAELEKANHALREREAWLGLALEAGRVGIWEWDAKTRHIRLTSGVAAMLGLPEGNLTTSDEWIALIHPDDRARVDRKFRSAAESGAQYEIEYRVCRSDGSLAWVRMNGRFEVDSAGKPTSALGTISDVSESHALDARLRLVDRFVAAGTLAAGVAHEVNNPLTYLIGNVALLQSALAADPATAKRFDQILADMDDGLTRIRDVVKDLGTFARPEEEHVAAIDVRKVCDAAIRVVTHTVRHRARVETDYAEDTPLVLGNASRLGQVVINLVVNASHAMPPDRPAADSLVRVRTARSGDDTVLEVEDNGVGIEPGTLGRIFDPFFTTKSVGEGTGLGLSVCQGIVSSIGGHIDVDTQVGRGTTFRVVLPSSAVRAPSSSSPPRGPSKGGRVLLVDDDPLVRRALRLSLERHGYEVEEAASGTEGLERATGEKPFSAILCDLMMYDRSGREVHAELARTRPELARRMVFITGGTASATERAFREESGLVFLQKPVEMGALLDALDAAAGDRT